MLHECNYCNKYKGIQAFHYSQEDVICNDCYDKQFDKQIEQAFILEERARLKAKLQQIDLEELPF